MRKSSGIALVAALLTLASLSALALATSLLLSFDLKLAENRQEQAIARAQATSRLTLALLALESSAGSGEFPLSPPPVDGVVGYLRIDRRLALLEVEGSEGSGRFLSAARVELRPAAQGWRVYIVERR